MSRLAPADWRTLVRIFEADGFTQDRTTGSHVVLTKPGIVRPVIIPKYSEVGVDITKNNSRILTSSITYIRLPLMRTTLTIEPDVEQALLRELQRTDRSMKAVVNDALRIGLGMQGKPRRAPRFKVQPHAFAFKPGIDTDRLNQLLDELEAEERSRQLVR